MMSMFDKVKAVCALVVMGIGLVAYSATPTVTSVTAQQRYPWNGLVDIVVTFNGAESDVAKANCTFAATNSATKTALAIAHVTQQGEDTGSGTTWTRRFIWDTNADLGEVKIDDVELVADVEAVSDDPDGSGGVQLWEGGPYWATCNVGASKPEEYGLYFWWGDTVGHAGDWAFNVDNWPTLGKTVAELRSLGYIDSSGNLAPAHDAARKHLGAPWRMPTHAEFSALISNCDTQWTTRNGVNGQLVKGRGAYSSKSVFLPAAGGGNDSDLLDPGSGGYYWSSTPYSDYSVFAWILGFTSGHFRRSLIDRYYGQSVRPLRGFGGASAHFSLDNRTGMRVANATERIVFSPAWETDAVGATAVVSTNGVTVKSATEAGVYEWTPSPLDGTYELTHAIYANGVQVGETLTATFVAGGIVPRGCDWTKGTIELGWFADAQSQNPITYNIYWSGSADPASCVGKEDHCVETKVFAPSKIGVQELTISDDKYLAHGDGLKPIYYHVVGTDGSKSFCVARRRFGLFVGYTNYEYDSGKSPESLPSSIPEANDFWNKFILAGGVLNADDAVCRWDENAKKGEIDKALSNFCAKVGKGDIFVFYDLTHGVYNLKADEYIGISCYDGTYSISSLGNRLDQVGAKGAAVIAISGACGSGSMAERCGTGNNKAWITATTGKQTGMTSGNNVPYTGFNFSYFGRAFLEWGWERGLAEDSNGRVTYYDLARYAQNAVEGVANDRVQKPNFLNEGVLRQIVAYTKTSSIPEVKLKAPSGFSVRQLPWTGSWGVNVEIGWNGEANTEYRVCWREQGKGYEDGGWRRFHVTDAGVQTIALPDFDLTDYVPEVGKTYWFRMCGVNSAGNGYFTEECQITVGATLKTILTDAGKIYYDFIALASGIVLYKMELPPTVSAFELVLPATIDNTNVEAIGNFAFRDNLQLDSVVVPGNVIALGDDAFSGCENLDKVVFLGAPPIGVDDSQILKHVTKVCYSRAYADQYSSIVPDELFAGYTDEDPVAIQTAVLAGATEMVDYEEQLECSGGVEPYSWWMSEDGYRIDTETNSFAEVGEAQGWHTDSGAWEYELPFAFNCCGRTFKMVRVDDDANLEFDDDLGRYASIYSGFGDLYSEGAGHDVFVEQDQDQVTFRWNRVKYSDRDNIVNYAVTLYSNGVIRCSFGECTDAVRSVEVYGDLIYGAYVEQEGDDDIVLVPNYLPIGLSLDEDGIIRGVPEQAGHYDFEAMVQDDEGEICSKMLSVDVAENPNRRPMVDHWDPDGSVCLRGGERRLFSVHVSDPEGDELFYRWYLGGEEIEGADGSSCELVTTKDMRGRYGLTCEVSDGLWSFVAHEWSVCIGGELYVSAEDGADALQNALDEAIDGDVIFVGPGTYSSVEVPPLQGVRIVATDGCANTIIDGNRSASCFRVTYGISDTNSMVRLEGFTLQNGCADMGGGAMNAWLVGCVVLGNVADYYGGGLCYGRADSCLIVGNSSQYGGGAYWTDLYNCTVYFNSVYDGYGGGVNGCGIANTIVWENYQDDEVEWFTTVDGNPLFVDAEHMDFRLSEGSPCIGMGDNSQVATAYDLAGNVRIQGGSVDLGAYESAYSLPRPDAVAGLSVSPRTYAILLDWLDATYAKWYKVYRVEEALDDSAAELIATVSDAWYEDESALYETAYRYWVVPCNEVGEGERSELEVGGLLPPLNIVDAKLPDATSGSGYEFALQATGGDGCYSWSVPTYDVKIEEQSTYEKVGEPMGWFDDDASWNYELPFDFPLGEDATSVVEVDDNGYLALPFERETVTIYAAWDLDLYANPGDVYVSKTDDAVTFRWERVVYTTGEAVNVSATLYANGCIRLSCDSGAASVARALECQDADYWYGVPGDIVLTPNTPPPGLELSDDGVLSGEPTDDGAYRFAVKVEDGNGERATRKISLNVKGNSTDPIPDIGESPSAIEVYEALEGSTDSELQVNITDAATYNAYREWALKIGAAEVKASPFAWGSFATDSAALLAKMPTDDDLKVEEFKPSAMAGSFDFTVSVKDVTIGDKASVDNLKKLFVLEGAESLDTAAFSSENVSLDFREPQDGKLKLTATPAVDNAKSFFMKAKVK